MERKAFILGLVLVVSALAAMSCDRSTPEPDAGLANPASVYCQEQGYELVMRSDDSGTYGVCVFPDGSECEEWAYYRGECGPGTGEPQPTEPPAAPTEPGEPEGACLSFEGVSFCYDRSLAADVVGAVIPAEGEGGPEWAMIPEHVRFSFEGYTLPDTFHEPRILVFSAEDLEGNEMLQGIATNIRWMVTDQPGEPVGVFQAAGILPPMNAGHMMTTQVAYLDFQNGSGVRFLTQMGQAYYAISSYDLFYTFQGITGDGQHYVAAILPVSHPSLPADSSEIPGGDFDAFAADFDTYSAEIAAQLDGEADDSFGPGLDLLDQMMQSLNVSSAVIK